MGQTPVVIADPNEPGIIGHVKINPHVDTDTVFTWVEGLPTQVVTTGLGKTTTDVLTWSDNELQSDATVII